MSEEDFDDWLTEIAQRSKARKYLNGFLLGVAIWIVSVPVFFVGFIPLWMIWTLISG